ncbi:MAG: ATP-binding cassette domain-containing protein [Candidatus Kerfeldbacteria bacterium]|nr:ATP-binding cassette domain-containing protein [Candidatus Kerfeldbacteria bacterium]
MLKVEKLAKQFGDFKAVQNVSFHAPGGVIFGLLGPNGAGKTTVIRMLATILTPTAGTADLAGFDIVRQPEEVRRRVGVLTADIGLYDRYSARENLRYFGELYGLSGQKLESRIEQLIDMLDMRRFADRRAGKFSTGMKQKVAIARSIVHDPDIIIFDEPTAGLDVLASQTVVSMMRTFRQAGKLVVLSTHDMHDAERLCDQVAIVHRGLVVATGSVNDIRSTAHAASLEEAFLQLVGEDAARQATLETESRTLAEQHKRKGFPWRRS